MNILFLTYEGQITGSTNSIAYLCRGLAERGHNIYLGCRRESLLYEMLQDSKVNLIPMVFKGKLDFSNIRHIHVVVKKYHIQIINAQSSYDRYTSILARWIYRLNVKVIHTRRQTPMSMGGWLQNNFYVKGTDKIVAVSNGVKKELVKKGLPPNHIEVIYNGTPKDKYEHINPEIVEQLKNDYDIKDGDFVIGCVSRLKSQIHLIQALQYIPVPVKVIFIGINTSEQFQKIISNYPVPHKVYFKGIVPMKKTLHHYKLFSLKVLASKMEGLSQSLLEAMALEVPVIATNCAGNPDLISDWKNGLMYENDNPKELAEKILLLMNDPALRKKLIINGKKTALEDFSIDKTIANYEFFFRSIIKKKNKQVAV